MIDHLMTILAHACVIIGTLFGLIAALGLWRMPDIYSRLHCTAKAGTVGGIFVVAGVALYTSDSEVWLRCAILLVFLAVTGPVAGHAIARSAWLSGVTPRDEHGQPIEKAEVKP